jgi:hypothetical protein
MGPRREREVVFRDRCYVWSPTVPASVYEGSEWYSAGHTFHPVMEEMSSEPAEFGSADWVDHVFPKVKELVPTGRCVLRGSMQANEQRRRYEDKYEYPLAIIQRAMARITRQLDDGLCSIPFHTKRPYRCDKLGKVLIDIISKSHDLHQWTERSIWRRIGEGYDPEALYYEVARRWCVMTGQEVIIFPDGVDRWDASRMEHEIMDTVDSMENSHRAEQRHA